MCSCFCPQLIPLVDFVSDSVSCSFSDFEVACRRSSIRCLEIVAPVLRWSVNNTRERMEVPPVQSMPVPERTPFKAVLEKSGALRHLDQREALPGAPSALPPEVGWHTVERPHLPLCKGS